MDLILFFTANINNEIKSSMNISAYTVIINFIRLDQYIGKLLTVRVNV